MEYEFLPVCDGKDLRGAEAMIVDNGDGANDCLTSASAAVASGLETQRILCHSCGTVIAPNPAAMCLECLAAKIDISDGIPKQCMLQYCRQCGRYQQPPNQWLELQLESRELLAHCLRRLRGLAKVDLVSAAFLWTEPHSKRVRIKFTIQKEVFSRTFLRQWFVVDYVVAGQQCSDCARLNADQTWRAVVQVRQKVPHKRTFLYLEQLILKQNRHKDTVKIRDRREGIDFYFAERNHAFNFANYIRSVVPLRMKTSEQLLSTDEQNGSANVRYTISAEIAPICRDDLICLSPKQMQMMGFRNPLVLCTKVRSLITLLEPETLRTADLDADKYFRDPLVTVLASAGSSSSSVYAGMSEFLVIDSAPTGLRTDRLTQTFATVRRDGGVGDEFFVRSHLGNLMHIGDTFRGYDLSRANSNCSLLDAYRHKGILPDLMLVQKIYSRRPLRKRYWDLERLPMATSGEDGESEDEDSKNAAAEYERFLCELEEDAEFRKDVNLYVKPDEVQRRLRRKDDKNGSTPADAPENALTQKRAKQQAAATAASARGTSRNLFQSLCEENDSKNTETDDDDVFYGSDESDSAPEIPIEELLGALSLN